MRPVRSAEWISSVEATGATVTIRPGNSTPPREVVSFLIWLFRVRKDDTVSVCAWRREQMERLLLLGDSAPQWLDIQVRFPLTADENASLLRTFPRATITLVNWPADEAETAPDEPAAEFHDAAPR